MKASAQNSEVFISTLIQLPINEEFNLMKTGFAKDYYS